MKRRVCLRQWFPQRHSPNRAAPVALVLSLLLHLLLLTPLEHWCRSAPAPGETLIKVSLLQPTPRATPQAPPRPQRPQHKSRPRLKAKPKRLKRPKKHARSVKQAPLAHRKKPRRKRAPATSPQLEALKKRLARQREEERLAAIRRRLRAETATLPPSGTGSQARLREYQQHLKALLLRHWQLPEPLLSSGLEATVSLTIAASGKLLQQKEEKLSGNLIFDNAMRQAIRNAAPFPPFPPELALPQEEFVIKFNPRELHPGP